MGLSCPIWPGACRGVGCGWPPMGLHCGGPSTNRCSAGLRGRPCACQPIWPIVSKPSCTRTASILSGWHAARDRRWPDMRKYMLGWPRDARASCSRQPMVRPTDGRGWRLWPPRSGRRRGFWRCSPPTRSAWPSLATGWCTPPWRGAAWQTGWSRKRRGWMEFVVEPTGSDRLDVVWRARHRVLRQPSLYRDSGGSRWTI